MVGFRAFAERQAHRLGVTGLVRNLPDGTVEVIAEGEKSLLEAFLEELRRGPGAAWVKDVAFSWQRPTGEYQDFHITY